MIIAISNKKYQSLKIFLSDNETLLINSKETKKVNVIKESDHMKDLAKSGLISIKKVGE